VPARGRLLWREAWLGCGLILLVVQIVTGHLIGAVLLAAVTVLLVVSLAARYARHG
jgi:hypothetical protein